MGSRNATVLTNVGKSLGPHGEALLAALREAGHTLLSASRKGEALRLAAEAAPDLVLLNPRRPRMDGYSLCAALREESSTASIPIVLIGAKATQADVVAGFEAGATDFITTPSRTKEVLARLGRHLSTGDTAEPRDGARASGAEAHLDVLPALLLEMDEKGNVFDFVGAEGVLSHVVKRRTLGKKAKAKTSTLFNRELSLVLMDAVHQAATQQANVTATCRCGTEDHEGWIELAVAHAAAGDEGKRFMVLARDVSERKAAEEARLRHERTALGEEKTRGIDQLAVGISHGMNNVLGVIMGLVSSSRTDLAPHDPRREDVERILEACRRGYDLTSKLSCLANDVNIVTEPLSLNSQIEEALVLLGHSAPRSVEIETVLDRGGAAILGDPILINHVLVNLANNAFEAMPLGGVLRLSTETITVDQGSAAAHPELKSGEYVVLRVADNGQGMTQTVKARALEPFFTTKGDDGKPGLGLAMVSGITRSHGGMVTLESNAGDGTEVAVYIPAAEHMAPIRVSEVAKRRSSTPPAATALLIDDDELILYATRRLLQRLGYVVHVARGGAEGVEVFEDKRDEISVVLLDLIMPGMDGAATFRKIREIDPTARVILCTGYSDRKVVSGLEAEGLAGVLKKPFEMNTLTRMLEESV